MLDDTLAKIKALKDELKKLDEAHTEKARSVSAFADAAAHEVSRRERSPKRVKLASDGLADAAAEFESTHPKLTATVAEICRELSSLGI